MTAAERLTRLSNLLQEWQLVQMASRGGGLDAWKKGWRARARERTAWQVWVDAELALVAATLPTPEVLAVEAVALRGGVGKRFLRRVTKADTYNPATFAERLRSRLNDSSVEVGALERYIEVALRTGEVAGQYTLDQLGLDRTFAWAHPRNMGRALYEVRGSKVIQSMHGTHIDELAKIIGRATDPKRPMTIDQVTKEIRTKWDGLTRYQGERIARTETAAVWQGTSLNAMVANGCPDFDWLTGGNPCPECVDAATGAPYTLAYLPDSPPLHPLCECELVQGSDYLPPDDIWTGGDLEDLIAVEDF